MAAEEQEQASGPLDFQRYLGIVRRRHVHFLVPLLLGWLAVWGASWVVPVRYKSGTLILVEQPTMPKNYVEPNVSDDLQERLQSISQQILSRTRLLLIIDKLHLYAGGKNQATADDKVEMMRKDIEIVLVKDSAGEKITAFRVNYSARDPHMAQQVTSELTDLFINENLKVRQQESEDTTQFIASQLENARASLAEQEAKVREFQTEHQGALPSQQASNMQILSGLQEQLQSEQGSLNTAKQQRVYLSSTIDQYRGYRGASRLGDGEQSGSSANPTSHIASMDQELIKLQAKLADLSSRYTDSHPDVLSVRQQIAKTERMRDELIASRDSKSKANGGKLSGGGTALDDVTDGGQNGPVAQLQGQLQANQAEISNREHSIAGLKARIGEYQARLNDEPAVEQKMDDLTRGYEQSKADYDSLLKKKNDSEMATNMEQMQQGERFSILDPPTLPLRPDFPNRLKFCGIGLGIGVALGIVVAGGFELLDNRLYTESELKKLIPVPILSEVPELLVPSDERRTFRRMALGWSMAAFVVATILAGSAFSYLHN